MKNFFPILFIMGVLATCGQALAAPGVQICDGSTPPHCAPVDATNGVKVDVIATVTGPTGPGTAATGFRVTLSADDAAALQNIATPNADSAALITLAAAGAGTTDGAAQTNNYWRGVQVGVNLTVETTCSAVINIQGKDVASGTWYTILASPAIIAAGFSNLTVYPGAAATANVSSSQPLPHTWRVEAVLTGASCATTGTIGASEIR